MFRRAANHHQEHKTYQNKKETFWRANIITFKLYRCGHVKYKFLTKKLGHMLQLTNRAYSAWLFTHSKCTNELSYKPDAQNGNLWR
jgi:hypothetical protein